MNPHGLRQEKHSALLSWLANRIAFSGLKPIAFVGSVASHLLPLPSFTVRSAVWYSKSLAWPGAFTHTEGAFVFALLGNGSLFRAVRVNGKVGLPALAIRPTRRCSGPSKSAASRHFRPSAELQRSASFRGCIRSAR